MYEKFSPYQNKIHFVVTDVLYLSDTYVLLLGVNYTDCVGNWLCFLLLLFSDKYS